MISKDDLKAAVNAGVISEIQASSLAGLAQERQGLRGKLSPSEEPFELFQGLNEIFIVVGLSILFAGWMSFWIVIVGEIEDSPLSWAIVSALSLLIIALLSRYFIQKRRMIAPAIAISACCAYLLAQFGITISSSFELSWQNTGLVASLICFFGLVVYWIWFRVPFALALIGISALLALYSISINSGAAVFDLSNAFLLSADGPFALITMALGLVLFAAALRFDLLDPHRITRNAANGFWLHLVAAPAIINTIALTLLDHDTTSANLLLILFLTFMALIAIVIDRRSFLMAGAGYAVALSVIILEEGSPLVILALGLLLVILGSKWEAIRAGILARLPNFPAKDKLPPWTNPSAEPLETI